MSAIQSGNAPRPTATRTPIGWLGALAQVSVRIT